MLYRDFLTAQGDFDISTTDWRVNSPNDPMEDIAGVKFQQTRELTYQHPRTTMLMFGPKNAPGKQRLPGKLYLNEFIVCELN